MALGVVAFAEFLIDNYVPDGANRIVLPLSLYVVAVTPFSDVGEFQRISRKIHITSISWMLNKVDTSLKRSGNVIDKCSICLEDYDHEGKENIVFMPCSHIYHKDCIIEWLLKSRYCPLCRYSLPWLLN